MTDAFLTVARLARRQPYKALVPLFFLIPILGNAISRLSKKGWWLNDFDALICGADHLRRGVSPYSLHPICAGLRPAVYVYAPQVAKVFVPLIETFSLAGARFAYLFLLIPMMAVLLWYALFASVRGAPILPRLMTLAAMAGSAFACGNIGWVLHGLVISAALIIRKHRWLFVLAVAVSALIKPVFLTYFIVLLLEERPLLLRIRTFACAVATGLLGICGLVLTTGPLGNAWHGALSAIVIHEQPGIGFFSFSSLIGFSTTSPATLIAFGLFALIIASSAFVVAEWGHLTPSQRLVLGIGAAQLLNPRLMDYDMLALAPCMVVIISTAKPLGERIYFPLTWVFCGTMAGSVVINLLEISAIHRAPVTVFIYCIILAGVATLTVLPQAARIRGWCQNPLPVLQNILAQKV